MGVLDDLAEAEAAWLAHRQACGYCHTHPRELCAEGRKLAEADPEVGWLIEHDGEVVLIVPDGDGQP